MGSYRPNGLQDDTRRHLIFSKPHFSRFLQLLNDDLNTPKALAYAWELLKEKPKAELYGTLLAMDEVFGLNLAKVKPLKISVGVKKLVAAREKARQTRDWKRSDELRQKLQEKGYVVEDTPSGPLVKRT